MPNAGMATTIDIGEAKGIHPKNKRDVGRRLANWALAGFIIRRTCLPAGRCTRVTRSKAPPCVCNSGAAG